ncbi:MAG: hypothetical protein Q4G26_13350, partial [Paracoccus sp. (in: a-proteobacteria)]|nr:hypothetical protein [Paracoccus sp. (in: a-proteobacteria)]
GPAIRVADDGPGLDDPQNLFSLGRSGWDEGMVNAEDAAGMGLFALANRGVGIIARRKATDTAWQINASADAFAGKEPVIVSDGPDGWRGMAVIFPESLRDNLAAALRQAARFSPLPVTFNGEALPREDFLAEADHIEDWRGIRIGIYERDTTVFSRHGNANVHGITLRVPLPALGQLWHRSWHARIDVIHSADLKLVLPARKEVVQNEMFSALCNEIRRVFYRLIARAGAHSLSFADHRQAVALGISLPEAAPMLRPFLPDCADGNRAEYAPPETIAPGALLYAGADAIEEQNMARALTHWADAPTLWQPCPSFEGYAWYDRLRTITPLTYRATLDGDTVSIEPCNQGGLPERPDRLEVVLGYEGADSPLATIGTDLLLLGSDYPCLDEAEISLIRKATITPRELVNFFEAALFSPSDDSEAGSYDQQLQWFCDEAEDWAVTLLQSAADADLNLVRRIICRDICWRLPKGCDLTIRLRGREVSVETTSAE